MRRIAPVVLVLVLVSGACAPGRDAVVVGAVYPTGGSQGPGGAEEYRGVELAAALANRRGGVDGRPVRLRFEAVESAEAAPPAVDRLADAGVPVILGSYGSTISKAAASASSRRGLVFWETGAVGDVGMSPALGRTVFRVTASGTVLGREAVAFVRDRVASDARRYAVAYVDDVYGRSVGGGALAEIERAGLELAAELPYALVDADYDAIARAVGDAGAEVFVVAAYLDDGVELRRAIVRNGVELRANIGTSSSYCMPAFGEILGPQAVGVFASDKPDGDVLDAERLRPEGAEALEWARTTYRDRFHEPMSAPALTGFAGALALFRYVLPGAGDLSPGGIAAAARSADLPAGSLPNGSGLRFAGPEASDPGANLRAASVIWQWVEPEHRAVVWPPAFATAPMVAAA
jgi:branched-chain amino acid transport system substrate-binding protein